MFEHVLANIRSIRFAGSTAGVPTLIDAQTFLVSTAAVPEQDPAVAFNGTDYLVVWEDQRNGPAAADIHGVRLDQTGTVLDAAGIVIAQAPNAQVAPAVASNGTDWLVTWQDGRSGPGQDDIYAARVLASGTVADPSASPSTPRAACRALRRSPATVPTTW